MHGDGYFCFVLWNFVLTFIILFHIVYWEAHTQFNFAFFFHFVLVLAFYQEVDFHIPSILKSSP